MQKRTLAHRFDNLRCRVCWTLHRHRLGVCLLATTVGMLALGGALRDMASGPRLAAFGVDDFLIYIAVLVISGLIAAATAPKQKDPDVAKIDAPEVKDGGGIVRAYGTVWIDDSMVLGWQQLGTDPIKSDGGKK